jgi:hypothetical protein
VAALTLAACRGEGRSTGAPPARASASASSSATWAPAPPAGPEELAIVAPLAKGSDLGGYEVRDIRTVRDGVMRLVCVKDDATVRLDVALVDDEGPVPPATAGKYAVYYSLKGSVPEDGARLAQKLAKVLEQHQDAPVPKGMTKFVPKEKPGTML